MTLQHPVPIFRIFDEQKALEYYVDFLGFTVDWTHRFGENFPIYMQVTRGNCVLHLSEHSGDCTPGARIRVEVKGLDAFHKELAGKDYKYARPGIELREWNERDMTVADPFSNRITFYEPVQ